MADCNAGTTGWLTKTPIAPSEGASGTVMAAPVRVALLPITAITALLALGFAPGAVALDNGVGITPVMGFNTYQASVCTVPATPGCRGAASPSHAERSPVCVSPLPHSLAHPVAVVVPGRRRHGHRGRARRAGPQAGRVRLHQQRRRVR